MPDKIVVLISLLGLTSGAFIFYYFALYEPNNPHNFEGMVSSQSEDKDVSHNHNDMQEAHLTAVNPKFDEIAQDNDKQYHSGIDQDCKTETLPDRNSVMHSKCPDDKDDSYITDMQVLKEQVKDVLEKQTKIELSKTPVFELENVVESLKADLRYQMKNETETLLDEMRGFYNTKLANLSTTLSNLNKISKAELEKLRMSLSNLTFETQGNVRELQQSMESMYTRVEEDVTKKLQDVYEQLLTIQHAIRKDDERINGLQQLIEDRIFPNTFNKGIAVGVFLFVVALVLFLAVCLYYQNLTVQESRSEILSLKTKFVSFEQALTDTTERNEVPGKK